jgi:hypothetical protein
MTREEMIQDLAEDNVSQVIQMAINGDEVDLLAWLLPTFSESLRNLSDDELESMYNSQMNPV